MQPKTEPQLLLEDWAGKPAAPQKLPPLASTPANPVPRKRPGPKPRPLERRKADNRYGIWQAMRNRCNNPNGEDYAHYGGRGITVCERWNDFLLFAQDMGPRPTLKHEIDRTDNDGPYCPENCRWATRYEQMQHTRRNRRIEFDGKCLTVSEWSRLLAVPFKRICERLDLGWSAKDALTAPIKPGNRSFESHRKAWLVRKRNQGIK